MRFPYLLNQPPSYSAVPDNIYHQSDGQLNKVEYFYNRPSLSMLLESISNYSPDFIVFPLYGSTFSAFFNNINFIEVDMIPFFLYATESRINQIVQAPNSAIAPYINYSNANFSLIDSISITGDVYNSINSLSSLTTNYLNGGISIGGSTGSSPIFSSTGLTQPITITLSYLSGFNGITINVTKGG